MDGGRDCERYRATRKQGHVILGDVARTAAGGHAGATRSDGCPAIAGGDTGQGQIIDRHTDRGAGPGIAGHDGIDHRVVLPRHHRTARGVVRAAVVCPTDVVYLGDLQVVDGGGGDGIGRGIVAWGGRRVGVRSYRGGVDNRGR